MRSNTDIPINAAPKLLCQIVRVWNDKIPQGIKLFWKKKQEKKPVSENHQICAVELLNFCEVVLAVHMTLSNGNIFCVTGPLCREFTSEFPAKRPVTRSFDVFFDLCLNKRLSKQSCGWWFETPSCPLWHHSNKSTLRSHSWKMSSSD